MFTTAGSRVGRKRSAGGSGITQLTGDVTAGPGSGSQAATIKSSVALAGNPTTTTQSPLTDNTTVATTAYVDSAIATGGGGGPGGLSFFSPVMQRMTYVYVASSSQLGAIGDSFGQFGTAGGSGGSAYWGVTPAGTGSGCGINSDTWYTTGNNINAFFNFGLNKTANIRAWIGLTDQAGATMSQSDTPGGNHCGFRFSSVVPDAHWIAECTKSGVITTVDTGVAVNTSGQQKLAIIATTSSVKFYIGGLLVATISTNVPASGSAMALVASVAAITSTGAKFTFGYAYVFEDLA